MWAPLSEQDTPVQCVNHIEADGWQAKVHAPNLVHNLFLQIKFYWNTARFTHLWLLSCTGEEWSSSAREHMVHEAKNLLSDPLQKWVSTHDLSKSTLVLAVTLKTAWPSRRNHFQCVETLLSWCFESSIFCCQGEKGERRNRWVTLVFQCTSKETSKPEF